VGYAQLITDLTRVMLVPILHDAGPADDLKIGNFGQLGQKVVLDTVGKESVFFVVTQIFKRKHCDSSGCGTVEQLASPNDYA
jgi:hypothetical protein